jgi:hypothetical protein
MSLRIRSPKDFGAGLLYAGFGLTAILMAWDYGMGSASRMGPGYRRTGRVAAPHRHRVVRARFDDGAPIGRSPGRRRSSPQARSFRTAAAAADWFLRSSYSFWSARRRVRGSGSSGASGLMVVLIAFCALVFVKGLAPVLLLGHWFTG